MDNPLDATVNDILAQLKQTNELSKQQPTEVLTKDKLEEFIISNSGSLITKALNVIDDTRLYIQQAPDAKDVAAFAELLKAASAAMDTLNKVYISHEKNKAQKEMKTLEIEAKERMNEQDNVTYMLTRNEVMDRLFNEPKLEAPIDV